MTDSNHRDDNFVKEVRRQAKRINQGRKITFWQGLGLLGTVGWMIAIPIVGGTLLGRLIDRQLQTTPVCTLILLLIGVVAGCASAWRQVARDLGL